MRMLHYFAVFAALSAISLLVTAWLGIQGYPNHLSFGLISAIFTVGVHSLVILFMIVTGRVLREAIRSRDLPAKFLEELNVFFGKKSAYPAGVFGALSIAMAGVLGYGAPSLGWPSAVHMLVAIGAVVFNLWAYTVEFRALVENQALLDRAADALDAIDVELEKRGELPEEEPLLPSQIARGGMIVAISAWMPYFYWVFVVWRGDFAKASLHPWIEVSALGLFVWWLARKADLGIQEPGTSGS